MGSSELKQPRFMCFTLGWGCPYCDLVIDDDRELSAQAEEARTHLREVHKAIELEEEMGDGGCGARVRRKYGT